MIFHLGYSIIKFVFYYLYMIIVIIRINLIKFYYYLNFSIIHFGAFSIITKNLEQSFISYIFKLLQKFNRIKVYETDIL